MEATRYIANCCLQNLGNYPVKAFLLMTKINAQPHCILVVEVKSVIREEYSSTVNVLTRNNQIIIAISMEAVSRSYAIVSL